MKEAIMTDINNLMQEFWSDRAVGASLFAMRSLLNILQGCFDNSEVCFPLVTAVDLADRILQRLATLNCWDYDSAQSDLEETEFRAKFKIMFDGYQKTIDQSFSKSKDLGDMLRFLPGVVVQSDLSMQGMADLYRIEPDLLERLIKPTIGPLRPSYALYPRYIYKLDDYLSDFLQDRDRSRLYYCDPMLQHISICRQILFLLDRNDFQVEIQS